MAGSLRVGWSGKIMSMDESKKFFELITSVKKNHVAEKLFVALPGQFEILPVNDSAGEAEEAAKDGLGNILLANTVIGIMYLLLSMCFAELTSVVAFAGGSFGYCRAALGPFWGFLVGASEMLENFLYVVVTVMTIGSACTEVFGTSRQWEPVWYLLTYGLLVGVHLRGGELLWYTVTVCGMITVALILLFCVSEAPTIDVSKYGMQDGRLFSDGATGFMEAIYFPTTFYIGLEILPQTCDRVKN
eukprot:gene23355-biopygen8238